MRDKIKNDGLKDLVSKLKSSNDNFNTKLPQIKDPDIIDNIRFGLVSNSIQRTIALYSIGAEKEDVKIALKEASEAFISHFKWDGVELGYGQYDFMIWMVSLGVLCDLDSETFQKITAVINRDNADEKLLNFIIKSKLDDWEGESDQYIQAIPYAETASIESVEDIKNYLDNVWYQGHDEASWHDLHKNDKTNRYFGYWAWEIAAIAKIKGIDDESLKEHPFYPYDAIHW